MISEHEFSAGYGSFWHNLTPLSDGYWKVENMLVMRSLEPLVPRSEVKMRGVVNETSFRAFCAIRQTGGEVDRARVLAEVDAHALDAINYVSRLTSRFTPTDSDFDESCRREATQLALRLLHFFPGHEPTTLRPIFKGCGLISSCEGDLIEGDCLYEVKAGDRAFRITDLRQLLIYSALAYSAGNLSFKRIGLFNPRTGSSWTRTLDQVCNAVAGERAVDTLSALVGSFSSISVSR